MRRSIGPAVIALVVCTSCTLPGPTSPTSPAPTSPAISSSSPGQPTGPSASTWSPRPGAKTFTEAELVTAYGQAFATLTDQLTDSPLGPVSWGGPAPQTAKTTMVDGHCVVTLHRYGQGVLPADLQLDGLLDKLTPTLAAAGFSDVTRGTNPGGWVVIDGQASDGARLQIQSKGELMVTLMALTTGPDCPTD